MSLLMDALRKAEQAKKQAAGTVTDAVTPVGPLMPGGKQEVPEPQLSLEGAEHFADTAPGAIVPMEIDLEGAGQDKDGQPELSLAAVGGQEDVPVVDGEMVEVLTEEVPVLLNLDGDSGQDAGRGEGPEVSVESPVSGAASLAAVVKSHSEGGPQSDITEASPLRPAVASAELSRQKARTVFAAKKEYQRRSRKRRLLVLGIVGGIAVLGVAGFFFMTWRSMMHSAVSVVGVEKNISFQGADGVSEPEPQSVAGGESVAVSKETGPASLEPVENTQTSSEQRGESPSRGALGSLSPSVPPSLPEAAPVSSPSAPAIMQPLSSPSVSQEDLPLSPGRTSATDLSFKVQSALGKPAPAAIVITHRSVRPQASSLLTAAYEAYQKGDFVQARKSYQQALQDDPKNRGALLGLAAIAMQGHEETPARDLYLRLLDQDPGDPLARAGLLAIAPTGDPARQESELKLLLEQHPQSAPLFFSLGSLYAANQRWNEAQQAFFNALQAAKNDAGKTGGVPPDYPFNLAVSLEHLGQLKPAMKFYHEALGLATSQPAGFDADALAARLKTLDQGDRP